MGAEVLRAGDVERMFAEARGLGLTDDKYVPASDGRAWQPAAVLEGAAPLPPMVSLRGDQTPNKFQLQRGTCYAFATAAAMEAAINRRYGRLVDLSEQYLFQVYKTSDAQGPRDVSKGVFDTNSSLWGFQGNSNCVEAAARMAVPVEGAAPYLDQPELEWLRASIAAANPAPMGDLKAFTGQRQLDEVEWSAGVVPLAARHQAEYRVTAFHQVGAAPST